MIRRLVLALALAGASLATGAFGSPAGAVTPVVGSCHRLTAHQAAAESDTAPAVPCASAHTTQTVAVVTSPTSFAGLSEDQVNQQSLALCDPALTRALGPNVLSLQTAYVFFVFVPTSAEISLGESWARCDVGLANGQRLQPLPHHLLRAPFVRRPIPDSVRLCYAGQRATTCNHPHTVRTIGALNPSHAFPSTAAFDRYAHRRCPGATSYDIPSAQAWSAGHHVIVCYKKTRS